MKKFMVAAMCLMGAFTPNMAMAETEEPDATSPSRIYICGNVQNEDGSVVNNFTTPSSHNLEAYNEYWSLFEPENMKGEKIYVGIFWLMPQEDADENDPETASMFRFFTELLGWCSDASLGSNEADFYCLPITNKWEAGYSGNVVDHGLGNWGIHTTVSKPMTIVVDTQMLKIYIKEGQHSVTFANREPEFGTYNPGSVENVIVDNKEAEYFNMQGLRVNNPSNGIYIVKRDNKTSKILVK